MKSLSFQISSSLLYRRNDPKDVAKAKELGIRPIDCVICNLYPFEEASKDSDLSNLIENIDIGGPTMIRAAAKNYEHVLVCSSPSQYGELTKILTSEKTQASFNIRKKWALEAFRLSAFYDGMIANELDNPNVISPGQELVIPLGGIENLTPTPTPTIELDISGTPQP